MAVTGTVATWSPQSPLAKAVDLAGFSYDPGQDVMFSKRDALQRNLGYAYAYDAFAMAMDADIDCEPIFFRYADKLWMVELWKGQYGLMTGCEIGIYNRPAQAPFYFAVLEETIGRRPVDPDKSHGLFFPCASDADMLEMSFTLRRDGAPLFSRSPQRHWWLTGFRWGVYSTPDQLAMDVSIVFPNATMRQAFVQAIEAMGYRPAGTGLTVTFEFAEPRAPQPPRDAAVLATVRAEARDIVATYNGLKLPNSDPNQATGAAVNAIVPAVLTRTPELLGAIMAEALRGIGKDARYVADLLTNALKIGADAVSQWITAAGYQLGEWVQSVYSILHEAFTMNYSTAVEIVNVPNNGTRPLLLTLAGSGVKYGSWYVSPPRLIAPGGTGRFYLKDRLGFDGSEGWADYSFVDTDGRTKSVRFTFGCPTGFSDNYATVQPNLFSVFSRSGGATQWRGSVPPKDHPLSVAYVWAHGRAPA